MASPSHTSMTPYRLPKLSYRTTLYDVEFLNNTKTTSPAASQPTPSSAPTSPSYSNSLPSPRYPPSETSTPLSSRPISLAASSLFPRMSNNPPKKRANFFTGLLGVKEPSAQALADYQRHLLKQGNRRTTAISLPGVSSAKLPSTVPKVNSKWDGVPQKIKEKGKHNNPGTRRSSARLSRSIGTATSGGSENSSPSTPGGGITVSPENEGVLSGASSRNNLAEIYGWESPNMSSAISSRSLVQTSSRPTTSQTTSSWNAPTLHSTPSLPLQSSQQSPTIPQEYLEQPQPSRSCSPSPPSLLSASDSPSLTPCEPSPVTPGAPWPLESNITPQSEDLESSIQDGVKTTIVETPTAAESVIIKSTGVNILGPPFAAKRRPKLSDFHFGEQRPKTAKADLQQITTIETGGIAPKDMPSPSDPASPASNMRPNSAHGRLGLGTNIKHHDIAPWLAMDQGSSEGGSIVTPTLDPGRSLKRKGRISLFQKSH